MAADTDPIIREMPCVSIALDAYCDDYGNTGYHEHATVVFERNGLEVSLRKQDPGRFIVGRQYRIPVRGVLVQESHDGRVVRSWPMYVIDGVVEQADHA
jgi:hypothetical protein